MDPGVRLPFDAALSLFLRVSSRRAELDRVLLGGVENCSSD